MSRLLMVGILILGLALGSSIATAQNYSQSKPSPEVMFLDGLVGRPIGIAATAVGFATLVATLPFTLPSGSTGQAARGLVREPAAWTIGRPLGQNYMFHRHQRFWLP
ncbi:MAG: hypothetical protein JRI57_04650 [Deltaproteobacteria bacterium]|nr:hypothetical protein [Deltaproteobacteria bacterium]MBW1952547.1 hypothetical protein [Deltaproteobacteria bacterium]MBW1986110.1 hypothetical protein [Deltaproteobacteria bacterium]MBW2134204.1 hypothetical protein [Deltaproteobacteria bacterium]